VALSPDGMKLAAGYRSKGERKGGVVLWNAARACGLTGRPARGPGGGYERGLQPEWPRTIAAGYLGRCKGGVGCGTRLCEKKTRRAAPSAEARSGHRLQPNGETLSAGLLGRPAKVA